MHVPGVHGLEWFAALKGDARERFSRAFAKVFALAVRWYSEAPGPDRWRLAARGIHIYLLAELDGYQAEYLPLIQMLWPRMASGLGARLRLATEADPIAVLRDLDGFVAQFGGAPIADGSWLALAGLRDGARRLALSVGVWPALIEMAHGAPEAISEIADRFGRRAPGKKKNRSEGLLGVRTDDLVRRVLADLTRKRRQHGDPDAHRRRGRRDTDVIHADGDPDRAGCFRAHDPAVAREARPGSAATTEGFDSAAIASALSRLSPNEREALELVFGLDGREPQSYVSLAAERGGSSDKWRKRADRAVSHLRRILGPPAAP